jgi:hypothetical protein
MTEDEYVTSSRPLAIVTSSILYFVFLVKTLIPDL